MKVFSEAQLNQLLVKGTSAADVTNSFGPPGFTVDLDDGAVMWGYVFPIQLEKKGPHLGGFDVCFRNGKVTKWSPEIETIGQVQQPEDSFRSLGERTFEMYLATGALTNMANTVISNGLVDKISLEAPPDIKFTAKLLAGNSGAARSDDRTLILSVSKEDAARLAKFSRNNLGKQTLLVCGNNIIAAPGGL